MEAFKLLIGRRTRAVTGTSPCGKTIDLKSFGSVLMNNSVFDDDEGTKCVAILCWWHSMRQWLHNPLHFAMLTQPLLSWLSVPNEFSMTTSVAFVLSSSSSASTYTTAAG